MPPQGARRSGLPYSRWKTERLCTEIATPIPGPQGPLAHAQCLQDRPCLTPGSKPWRSGSQQIQGRRTAQPLHRWTLSPSVWLCPLSLPCAHLLIPCLEPSWRPVSEMGPLRVCSLSSAPSQGSFICFAYVPVMKPVTPASPHLSEVPPSPWPTAGALGRIPFCITL